MKTNNNIIQKRGAMSALICHRNVFGLLCLYILLFLIYVSPVHAASILSNEFEQPFDVINFDSLTANSELTFQLRTKGLRVVAAAPSGNLNIIQHSGAPSAPNVAVLHFDHQPLFFQFWSLRQKFGIYFGGTTGSGTAELSVFDDKNELIETVKVQYSKSSVADQFVGIDVEHKRIQSAKLFIPDGGEQIILDNLIIEPAHESQMDVSNVWHELEQQRTEKDRKLSVINSLIRQPSKASRLALEKLAQSDSDSYIREVSLSALVQLADYNSIPVLLESAQNETDPELRMSALNALWAMRQMYPLHDPPKLKLSALSKPEKGKPLEIRATITSPITRDNVHIAMAPSPGIRLLDSPNYSIFEGTLEANTPIEMTLRVQPETDEIGKISLKVVVTNDKVDVNEYWLNLYLNPVSGDVQIESFADPMGERVHILPRQN